jgi:hypothetical protein
MVKLKVGDEVVCTGVQVYRHRGITIGKTYIVDELEGDEEEEWIYLKEDDSGIRMNYRVSDFDLAEEDTIDWIFNEQGE